MNKDPFEEYIKESEPDKRDKGYAWQTAIGLQAVDGLKTSEYLMRTAVRNIEGEISFEEANALLETYYEENPAHDAGDRTEEADKVSARIVALLSERAFSFTPNEYISIHRKLFTGIYSHAGCIRDYNITKKEWVLNGATVLYGSATELWATLNYDFSEEKKFPYKNLSMDEIIHHLAVFVSGLWQLHVFGEGNTRTTAVFFIKYLRTLGFDVTNNIFAENAWYFRNSLVRANYNDLKNGIHGTTEYLEAFLRNLLLNEDHPLHNRTLHISGTFGKTASHILKFGEVFPDQMIFGRSDVKGAKIELNKQNAELALKEASEANPGAWVDHSRYVAKACKNIALHCKDLSAEQAYLFGLLHDIGRYAGVSSEKHLIDGYRYCMERGWEKAAQICISHAFMIQDIGTSIGEFDVSDDDYLFMKEFVANAVYDDYDRLVQLCDALAMPTGFCLLEKRFVDVTIRYGIHTATIDRWKKILEIKALFDKKTGCSIYTLLPGVVENSFR